jgi:seryl-tRNA synthetase
VLDAKLIRKSPDLVRAAIEKKGESVDFDRYLALDERRRDILQDVETKKHDRNVASQEIGKVKAAGGDVAEAAAKAKELSQAIKSLDQELSGIEDELQTLRAWIPNIPHESVPVGGEKDNVHVRSWGEPRRADFEVLPHYEIGERLGIMDTRRASALSGSGFVALIGDGARLSRALIRFMLDLHTREHGFTEVATPFIARRDVLFGTGQLPKLEEDMYHVSTDDLFLIPTAEVTVTNLYRDETIAESDLPIYLTAHTPCFRREAGAYGKDTRGLQRVHQFDKVELVKFVAPETSYDELESLVGCAAKVLERLEIPYRVALLASRDLSFAAAKCYDLEAWAPAEEKWLEVSSCSNFEDFQARRIGIRMKRKDGKGSELVHTLNGSGLALPRVIIAILENYQTERGTIRIPEVLVPYMDGQEEITAR